MAKYRKKPVIIEAIQYDGFHTGKIHEFCGNEVREPVGEDYLEIETLEGNMLAAKGDYIIKGINGEFYPCKPDIFEKIYEPVDKEVVVPLDNIGGLDRLAKGIVGEIKSIEEPSIIISIGGKEISKIALDQLREKQRQASVTIIDI